MVVVVVVMRVVDQLQFSQTVCTHCPQIARKERSVAAQELRRKGEEDRKRLEDVAVADAPRDAAGMGARSGGQGLGGDLRQLGFEELSDERGGSQRIPVR